MALEKILFYGYDRSSYNDCIDLIRWTDRRHMRIINSWFLAVNLLYLIFSMNNLFGVNETFIPFYSAFVGISVLFEGILFLFRNHVHKITFPLMYLMIIMLSVYGILSSLNQPYMAAIMLQVLLVLVSLSFIDNLARMGGAVILCGGIFLYASYSYKPMVIVYQDIYNTIVFLSLALVLHYAFQRARISQFITYQQNVAIQHTLAIQSDFDGLTGVLSRSAFFKLTDVLMESGADDLLVLCLLDLDGFKEINDTYGHQIGDMAIQRTGTVLLETLGISFGEKWSYTGRAITERTSFAGRLGGDEFICLIRGLESTEEVRQLVQRLMDNLNAQRFEQIMGLHASFGLTVITDEDRNIDGPYQRADDALYESKRGGKNRITFNNKYKRWREP